MYRYVPPTIGAAIIAMLLATNGYCVFTHGRPPLPAAPLLYPQIERAPVPPQYYQPPRQED